MDTARMMVCARMWIGLENLLAGGGPALGRLQLLGAMLEAARRRRAGALASDAMADAACVLLFLDSRAALEDCGDVPAEAQVKAMFDLRALPKGLHVVFAELLRRLGVADLESACRLAVLADRAVAAEDRALATLRMLEDVHAAIGPDEAALMAARDVIAHAWHIPGRAVFGRGVALFVKAAFWCRAQELHAQLSALTGVESLLVRAFPTVDDLLPVCLGQSREGEVWGRTLAVISLWERTGVPGS